MAYAYRVKFSASLNASGDIVPGAAVNGFKTDTLSSGVICILIEEPSTGAWQICSYNTGASSGSRRTTIEESAGSPFTTLPRSNLIATFIAPLEAYVSTSASSGYTYAGIGAWATGATNGTAFGTSSDVRDVNGVAVGYQAVAQGAYATAVGANAYTDGVHSTVIGESARADSYTAGQSNGVNLFGADSYADMVGETVLGSSLRPHFTTIPIRAASGVDGGAGTYAFEAFDGYGNSSTVTGTLLRATGGGTRRAVRVQGVIYAEATSSTYKRVWDVDYLIDSTDTVLFNSFTVKHTGGAGTLTPAIAGSGALTITTGAAYAGLVIFGLLNVSKLVG